MRRVIVYKSVKVADMYLFVDQHDDLERVPPSLLQRFGRPVEAMRLELTPERRLARSEAVNVLESIATRGFYLQMPPVIDPRGIDPRGIDPRGIDPPGKARE